MNHSYQGQHCGMAAEDTFCDLGMGASSCSVAERPIGFPANGPGKAVEDGPSTWFPVTHVGDPEVFFNFCLSSGLGLSPCS